MKEIQNLPTGSKRKRGSLIEENKKLKGELGIARTKINNLQTQLRIAKTKILKVQLAASKYFKEATTTVFSKTSKYTVDIKQDLLGHL